MNFFKKWYIYQKERFPLLIFGIYILAIVVGTFCVSNNVIINNVEYEHITITNRSVTIKCLENCEVTANYSLKPTEPSGTIIINPNGGRIKLEAFTNLNYWVTVDDNITQQGWAYSMPYLPI